MSVIIDYARRLQKIRDRMQEHQIDVLVATRLGSLSYITGCFVPWHSAVIVPFQGEICLCTYEIDVSRVQYESWICDIRSWTGRPRLFEVVVEFLKERGLEKSALGLEIGLPAAPGLLLAADYEALKGSLPGAQFQDFTHAMNELFMIKEDAEVELLRRATEISAYGVEEAISAVDVGKTENQIAGVAEKAMRDAGSMWSWSLTGGQEIASGYRGAFPLGGTTPPTEKIIQRGEIVLIDVHAMYNLYLSEGDANVIIGKPTIEQEKLASAHYATTMTLIDSIRPDKPVCEAAKAALSKLEELGYLEYGYITGHGLGTCARIPPFITKSSRHTFRTNMVLIALTQITIPGVGGMRLEVPLLVTNDGNEILSKCPLELVIK